MTLPAERLLDPNTNLQGAIRELQGFTISALAGALSGVKIDLAAIRAEDTIVAAHETDNTAGTITDRTSATTISDIRASNTVTFASLQDGDYFEIGGVVAESRPGRRFTARTGPLQGVNSGRNSTGSNWQFDIGANDNESRDNAIAVINEFYGLTPGEGVEASSTGAGEVTITSVKEGAGGNDIELTESTSGARITLGGANLAGGTDTGGIEISADTSGGTIVLYWYDRK